jgi:hypothetical protein
MSGISFNHPFTKKIQFVDAGTMSPGATPSSLADPDGQTLADGFMRILSQASRFGRKFTGTRANREQAALNAGQEWRFS